MKLIITSIISENPFGFVVSGRTENDECLRAILPVDAWPAIDSVYEIDGDPEEYIDGYGRKHRQIKAKIANRVRTSGRLIKPWLESIPGVGSTRSNRLLDEFGEDILDYIGDPCHLDRLAKALDPHGTSLGEKLAAQVQARYIVHGAGESTAVAEVDFYLELEKCGIDDRQAAKKMFRLIGNKEAFNRLLENPYLASGLIPWKQADSLGQKLLARRGAKNPRQHPDRLAGACDATWRGFLKRGHTAASRKDFLNELKDKKVPAEKALQLGIDRRRVIEAGFMLRPPGAAYLETTLAKHLCDLMNEDSDMNVPSDLDGLVRASENSCRPLTNEQREAVCGILRSKFSILQGGAGTGKTTTMKAVVDVWEKMGGNIHLGAISGKASLHLSRSTSKLAQTLARHLLKFEKDLVEVNTKGANLFPTLVSKTLFVIDESSMVDLAVMNKLMGFIDKGVHLVLVGDTHQLPPVGLGQIYHDLVAADINVFRLTKTLRQKNEDCADITNPIIDVATDIREGNIPTLLPFEGLDTGAFHVHTNKEDVESTVVRLLKQFKSKVAIEEILVLASLRKTCSNINGSMATQRQVDGAIGKRLSSNAPWVSQGDPIICARNRYEEGLMNGQIGHINTLDPFTVRWDGEELGKAVEQGVYIDLESAWAITCHRAQGSEARIVIVALDGEFMLTREWLYTATTRASQQVVFVGPTSLIEGAVKKRATRTTYFAEEMKLRRVCNE